MSRVDKTMHEQAISQIKRKVVGSLKNCDVADGWPVFESFTTHVESLASELLKHKNKWLSISDVYSIFYDLIYEAISGLGKSNSELTGSLLGLLGEDGLMTLAERLVDFYISIPRQYEVYMPAPKGSVGLVPILLSDIFAYTVFSKDEDIPGGVGSGGGGFLTSLLSGSSLQRNKAYFKCSIEGYCSKSLRNETIRRAFSNFKIAIQQGLYKKLFKISTAIPAGYGLLGGLSHYSVEKSTLVCVDNTSNNQRIIKVELPWDVSKLLESLEFDISSNSPLFEVMGGEVGGKLKGYFRLPSLLMQSDDEDCDRIRSAIEWCFDSYATENTTVSFLQVCIALEAVFGDEMGGENLTKTLADRCAYLVGTSIAGRKKIRENFRKLYEIRSKLVHGSASSLKADQQHYLDWGRNVVEYSISKELKHLNLVKE